MSNDGRTQEAGHQILAGALLLGLIGGAAGCADGADEVRPRNVLLIVVDTLRADRLSCYGYERETSPNIDALAGRGVRYTQNHSQGCWTVPSMVSMISGLWVTDNETALSKSHRSLGETLDEAGYATAAFIGNPVLKADRGFQRGFDHFELGDPDGNMHTLVDQFETWFAAEEQELAGGPGFFAWVHPVDPHHPYNPDHKYRVFRGQRPDADVLTPRWREATPRIAELVPDGDPLAPRAAMEVMGTWNNAYDGEVLAADDGVGRLLDFLEQRGVLEETLVIFASDHGEMLWEHEQYPLELSRKVADHGLKDGLKDLFAQGHRAWFHKELWNTPLIVAGPGMPVGEVVDGLAANLDIYPTILDSLNLSAKTEIHGQSLWGGARPDRDEVFGYGFQTTAMLDGEGFKLIEHNRGRFLLPEDAPLPLELFNQFEDPGEMENLADKQAQVTTELLDTLRTWRDEYRRDIVSGTSAAAQADLRNMGYMGYDDDEDGSPDEGPPETLDFGTDGD